MTPLDSQSYTESRVRRYLRAQCLNQLNPVFISFLVNFERFVCQVDNIAFESCDLTRWQLLFHTQSSKSLCQKWQGRLFCTRQQKLKSSLIWAPIHHSNTSFDNY